MEAQPAGSYSEDGARPDAPSPREAGEHWSQVFVWGVWGSWPFTGPWEGWGWRLYGGCKKETKKALCLSQNKEGRPAGLPKLRNVQERLCMMEVGF